MCVRLYIYVQFAVGATLVSIYGITMSFSYVAKTKTHSRLKITGFTDIYVS